MGKQPVAVVTGASRGVGKVIAGRLAREGMAVVLCSNEPEELGQTAAEIKKGGATCLSRPTDITNEEQVQALIEEARGAFGRLDVLVNNAAIIGPPAPVASLARKDWDDVLAVNLTGAMLCAKAVL